MTRKDQIDQNIRLARKALKDLPNNASPHHRDRVKTTLANALAAESVLIAEGLS